MRSNFEKCLKWVLIDEGGNDDDPRDHGGRTSRGIIQREYDAYRARKGKEKSDVWKASDAEVKEIYLTQYWEPYCDGLPSGVDYCFFDISVNSGRTAAVRNFQKALNVRVDGMMGTVTQQAIREADPEELIKKVLQVRRAFYRSLKQFNIYGKGWMNRADHLERGALSLVVRNAERDPQAAPRGVPPKARPENADSPTINPTGAATTTAASGGALSLIDQAKEALVPYADAIRYVQYFLLGLAAIGLVFTVYGFWKRTQIEKAL